MQFQRSRIGRSAQCLALLVLIAGLSSAVSAGKLPVCGDGRCNKGETAGSCGDDCGGNTSDTSGSIFKAEITGMMTGSIYTRPDQNVQADPKNVAFQPNRGNEVMMEIDTAYLVDEFGENRVKACFFPLADDGNGGVNPFIAYEGSLHLNDYFKQRADLAAYFWFWVGDVQYVFEFRDDGVGWYGGEFPPAPGDGPIQRDAWKWLLRVTTRNADNPCVTEEDVPGGSSSDPMITFELSSVDACEYPYDEVDCPTP